MRIGIAVALHGVRELAFAFAEARLASPDLGNPNHALACAARSR
jgi:hypothetical protein